MMIIIGRRVAAFGYMAGFAGSAVGIDVWCHQKTKGSETYGALKPYPNEDALIEYTKKRLAEAGKCLENYIRQWSDQANEYMVQLQPTATNTPRLWSWELSVDAVAVHATLHARLAFPKKTSSSGISTKPRVEVLSLRSWKQVIHE